MEEPGDKVFMIFMSVWPRGSDSFANKAKSGNKFSQALIAYKIRYLNCKESLGDIYLRPTSIHDLFSGNGWYQCIHGDHG